MSNYAIIENEYICSDLENIADWLREKDENISPKNRKRLDKLAKKAELDCQMNRNKYCYSCVNATDRCFRNEIGCPCEKYKSHKDEIKELKEENKFLKEQCLILADGNVCNSTCSEIKKQLNKAKEIIKEMLSILPKENIEGIYEITEEAEQFLNSKEAQ